MNLVLRSKRVLLPSGITEADIIIENGVVEKVADYGSSAQACELEDMLIAPGIVDLHSDAIEKEIEPRPGAMFPLEQAVVDLDRRLALNGVTTMFHALAFETAFTKELRDPVKSSELVRVIAELNKDYLRVDNKIHVRYEVSSLESVVHIDKLVDENLIDLFSIMDHAPGQGQFKSVEMWEKFYGKSYNLSKEEMAALRERKLNRDEKMLKELIERVKSKGIMMASHDDCNKAKVDSMYKSGVRISEFPLSVEVAEYAREQGMATGMGAPNVVRGLSQSGNISARELIRENVCDYLCSDYHPASMLKAVYILNSAEGLPIEEGFKLVTSTPAEISGLTDRGTIEKGKRADLIVIEDSKFPNVQLTLSGGKVVHNMLKENHYAPHCLV